MGQAKRRGSLEDRKRQAQEREARLAAEAAEARRRKREEEEAKVAAMTDEEREAYFTKMERRSRASSFFLATAMLAGAWAGSMPRIRTLKGRRRY